MAATVDTAAREIYADGHEVVTELVLSALTAGLAENLAHGGPTGAAPYKVEMEVTTRPNDDLPILLVHDFDSDSKTNDTVNLRFDTTGSLTGAVVRVRCCFKDVKSGGLGNVYTAIIT